MKYLSVCSGIEAATVAWHGLGWSPVAFSEIESFPSAVLAHHYPDVPNLGDMTKYEEWPNDPINLLVGGTPCQSFSVAGLRKGLDDPRGNLMLTFGAIARKYRPRWLVWENVPGVLSSNGGRDFGTFLGMLGELGYGFAYRVLDAQYFGVPQRRRRVFVVGCLGDWRSAAAVLFERHSLQGNPAPSREARKGIAAAIGRSVAGCLNSASGHAVPGNSLQDADQGYLIPMASRALSHEQEFQGDVSKCLTAGSGQRYDFESETFLPVCFDWQSGGDARGLDPKETAMLQRNQVPAVAFQETADCLTSSYSTKWNGNASANNGSLYAMQPVAVDHYNGALTGDVAATLSTGGATTTGSGPSVMVPVAVRDTAPTITSNYGKQVDSSDTGLGPNVVMQPAVAFDWKMGAKARSVAAGVDLAPTLGAQADRYAVAATAQPAVAFHENQRAEVTMNDTAGSLKVGGGKPGQGYPALFAAMQVRRLTPRECERLQGFPDDYTAIPWRKKPASECPDGPRYKALGNSMAVPVMRWIGERINLVETLAPKA